MTIKIKEVFSLGNLWTAGVALLAVGIAYGATSTRLSNLETRQDAVEHRYVILLEEIHEDVGDLKVEMAKVGQDILWLKQQEISHK